MKISTNKYRGLVLVVWVFLGLFPEFINAQSCGFQTTCVPPSNWANGSWQMFNGTQNHTGRQAMRGNLTSGRYVKWSYTTGVALYSSPTIGDINNDGYIEVIVGEYNDKIYALRGTDGSLLWFFTTGMGIISSPAIGDIDNDGNIEVVVGSEDWKVYALKGTDGSLFWSFATAGQVNSSPAIGDINNDGQLEIVVGSGDGKVYALRGIDGSLIWSYITGDKVYSSPAIGDLNNDGQVEIVFGSYDGNVYAIRGIDGSVLWSYATGSSVLSSPTLGDIDNDGYIEVIISSNNHKVYALRGTDGSLLWLYTMLNAVYSTPAIGDINYDGQIEVIFGSWDNTLYALRGTDGSLIWQVSVADGDKPYPMPLNIIADVDPTPGLEIVQNVAHSSCCGITVVSASGSILWSWNLWDSHRSVSVGDVDGDGCVEIVTVGKSSKISVIDAASNEGGCGVLGNDDELNIDESEVLKPDDYVEIFTTDGKRIHKGKYKNFKPERRGIYFVMFKGNKVKKVVR